MARGRVRPEKVWSDPRLLGWGALMIVASPMLLYKKLKRHFVKRNEWEFDLRRWRVPTLTPEVPPARVVVAGPGPGELLMIDRLVALIEARRPDLTVGICLRNLDTLTQLREERPGRRLSVWPFDALPPVARWLKAERPELVVSVDRLGHPCFASAGARAGVRFAIVNARAGRSKSQGPFGSLELPVKRWQNGGVRYVGLQSPEGEPRFRPVVPNDCRIEVTGSLKADLLRRPLPDAQRQDLEAWLSPDALPLVAVGSTTDPEEEAMVLDAFIAVRQAFPCRLLLAPRDVRRCDVTLRTLAAKGLVVSRRSAREEPAEVLLLDTFGELAQAYSRCRAAYIGGFWGGGGGHNVLEPLEWGVPVAYGPHPRNFASERRIAEEAGAGFAVDGASELADFWLRFLRDDAARERIGAAGKEALERSRGSFERTVEALLGLID